jgi:hypothetical protein
MTKRLFLFAITALLGTALAAQTTYTFTGHGKWSDSSNWLGNTPPPTVLPKSHQIIINPADTAQCILDVPQYISDSAQLIIGQNKKLLIAGNLLINKSEIQNNVLVVDTARLTLVSDSAMLSQGICGPFYHRGHRRGLYPTSYQRHLCKGIRC